MQKSLVAGLIELGIIEQILWAGDGGTGNAGSFAPRDHILLGETFAAWSRLLAAARQPRRYVGYWW